MTCGRLYRMTRAGGVFLALLMALALWWSDAASGLEARLMNVQFALLRGLGPRPQTGVDVVVVGIDDASVQDIPEPLALWHRQFGGFLRATALGGASVVGLDVVLPDRSFDAVLPGTDRMLLAGLVMVRRSTPVVLAATVDSTGQTRRVHPPFAAAAGEGAIGFALLPLEPDGVVRRFDEHIAQSGQPVPTLAGQMARRLGLPVRSGWIDFSLGPAFTYLPLSDVLAWERAGDAQALRHAFSGRPVLLGSVLPYEDRHLAPVALAGWEPGANVLPGVLLHAQVLRNLMERGLLQPAPAPLIVALFALTGLLWLVPLSKLQALGLLVAMGCMAMLASTLALRWGWHMPLAGAWSSACLFVLARQGLMVARQLRERAQLRSVFGGYVSPPIMRRILDGKLSPTMGGERRYCCVLFSDIRGYTTRSERSSPEQTISFLNQYFDRVVPAIHAHGGTVVSFMGDGIMAVFGAPNALPNPCESAYTASVAMLAQVHSANVELEARGEEPIRVGIGLHAGEGVAGHVGSRARHEYSVIGDVTNVASRLEGLTKEVGYQLVCSAVVAQQLPHRGDLVPLGLHAVKGRAPVEIFGAEPQRWSV